MENKKPTIKRRIEGVVVSDKMQKTRVIEVNIMRKHPKYLKYYKVSHRMKAHDEDNTYKVGDQVVIEETRPLSREKRWIIVSKRETTGEIKEG